MTRITNADQVLLILQSHLERARRARGAGKAGKADKSARQGPLERASALVSASELPEPELCRTIIAGILAEEFGPKVANEAKFQQVVDQVLSILRNDERTFAVLTQALQQLTTAE